jgi:biopolymer transport protein ExbD
VLRVQGAGPGLATKLYLNSKPLSWEELNSALKVELSQRSVWVVYVEADSNVSWQDALSAIDVARGLNAKVVLLTSRNRD